MVPLAILVDAVFNTKHSHENKAEVMTHLQDLRPCILDSHLQWQVIRRRQLWRIGQFGMVESIRSNDPDWIFFFFSTAHKQKHIYPRLATLPNVTFGQLTSLIWTFSLGAVVVLLLRMSSLPSPECVRRWAREGVLRKHHPADLRLRQLISTGLFWLWELTVEG